MIWTERKGMFESGSYRLFQTSRGEWDVWLYAGTNQVLMRGFPTAKSAKLWCDAHRVQEMATA